VNVDADSEKCSIAVLDAEQNPPGANITTFGDALWWACETVTTVGYGDRYPVTPDGRAIAVADGRGISMVMAITAAVAAWMVRQVELKGRDEEAVDD
jgi:voltage-gated potassium channel